MRLDDTVVIARRTRHVRAAPVTIPAIALRAGLLGAALLCATWCWRARHFAVRWRVARLATMELGFPVHDRVLNRERAHAILDVGVDVPYPAPTLKTNCRCHLITLGLAATKHAYRGSVECQLARVAKHACS
jgi:hypothetical protein